MTEPVGRQALPLSKQDHYSADFGET